MKSTTNEWVNKAEGDFHVMEREARARKNLSYDGICFHAQQCVEKYIKARLCEANLPIKKIHDLEKLLDRVVTIEPTWELFRPDFALLTGFAVNFRYPGESADREMALDARRRCRLFRQTARAALGLKEK